MKVVYTAGALRDLDEIGDWLSDRYKIFYKVTADTVEILHIHHSARQPWDEE